MLTPKQQELLSFIQNRLEEGGVSPSFEVQIRYPPPDQRPGRARLYQAPAQPGAGA
jgi:hypothetical protein